MSEIHPRLIKVYRTPEGRKPFSEWRDSLADKRARAKIRARLDRLELGNLGDWRSVGFGVLELRIDCGPGYRIYFGEDGKIVIILLAGGDKSSQVKDIGKAQEYWLDYRRRKNEINE